MRMRILSLTIATLALPLFAQPSRRMPGAPAGYFASSAETLIRQAMEQLGNEKKTFEKDLDVLQHLHAADVALTDPMQPYNAIQKATDEVAAAKLSATDFAVTQGLIRLGEALAEAGRSPTTADFGRLRATLRREAMTPAIVLVARNGARLQDETLAWMKVQDLIGAHLRTIAEITSAGLRAAQQ